MFTLHALATFSSVFFRIEAGNITKACVLDSMSSGVAAVITVNILLTLYIVLAMIEDDSSSDAENSPRAKKD